MVRRPSRTQTCSPTEARRRLDHARSFLEVAELTADVNDLSLEYASVAASVAILVGIAAADAACCHELGRRSRSENHHDAETLLTTITPGGKRAASQLRQLIEIKDTAHYGFITVTTAALKRATTSTTPRRVRRRSPTATTRQIAKLEWTWFRDQFLALVARRRWWSWFSFARIPRA
jgi:hypothetical protein